VAGLPIDPSALPFSRTERRSPRGARPSPRRRAPGPNPRCVAWDTGHAVRQGRGRGAGRPGAARRRRHGRRVARTAGQADTA
jgi:hypothetical protein